MHGGQRWAAAHSCWNSRGWVQSGRGVDGAAGGRPLPPPPIPDSSLAVRTSQTFVPRQAPWPARLRQGARAISEPLAKAETARCHLWELWNENVVDSNYRPSSPLGWAITRSHRSRPGEGAYMCPTCQHLEKGGKGLCLHNRFPGAERKHGEIWAQFTSLRRVQPPEQPQTPGMRLGCPLQVFPFGNLVS